MVGVDVSKLTLDVWLYQKQSHKVFSNNGKGFNQMSKWILEGLHLPDMSGVAFCFEHTGLYSLPLSIYLHSIGACYYQVSGLLVKRSLGLVRGKKDKADAKNLARFAFLHQQELRQYELPAEGILRLKQLLSFREKLIRQRTAHKNQNTEYKEVLGSADTDLVIASANEIISLLNEKIKAIEGEMRKIIADDPALAKTYGLVSGIKGVGIILSVSMIVYTNNFTLFSSWRSFACYSGTAPFEHQSGSSIRGRTKISALGNRALKTLLSQAAATAIQYNPELKNYYNKRIMEGKNKMSTLNIIRNKLISRMFAVVKRQTPFIDIYKFAA